MNIAYVLVVLVFVVGFAIYQKKRIGEFKSANADKNLGSVAARLGLTVVEGDPSLNLLLFQQPAGDFERKIRLTGRPYGRPTSFLIFDGQKTNDYLIVRQITHSFGCFLEAQTNVTFPAFEVVLRNPHQYLPPALELADRPELREVATGDPQLDALFVLRALDPRVGPALIPALRLVRAHQYVHFAGEGNRVWSSMTRMGLPYFGHAPEEVLLALETAACGLEGRPAPSRPATLAA